MNLSPEERTIGEENFHRVIAYTRRDFLKDALAAGAVSGAGLGAMYFGYDKTIGKPLRVGVIGTGDEGNVLIGAISPAYLEVVAIADIRPYNIYRAFHGDESSDNALKVRCGLMKKYGWKTEDEARRHVKIYDQDYKDLLNDRSVEAVIIALPLHLHDKVAIEAMIKGKHVLTEKLMAHSVHQCKDMARVAKKTRKILAVGHQRHYSILYDNAVDTIRQGLIGDIHSIRAQWHRENMPGSDSWQPKLPNKEMATEIQAIKKALDESKDPTEIKVLTKKHKLLLRQYEDRVVDAARHEYEGKTLGGGTLGSYEYSPLEELIRWRLFNRTGGGLMAELGSHQLDAAGIFISALRAKGEKAVPLSVAAMGGRWIFNHDRECEDHVYCTYEFPGKDYATNKDSKVGVAYSSINGNGYGGYGEVVMGTTGTLILEREEKVMLFKDSATTTNVGVVKKKDGKETLDTTESGAGAALGKLALETGPVSRGYTEEMEHFAWCIRNPAPENLPRCHPKVALGDAVIALTTNIAIRENRRIDFKREWFEIDLDDTPEGIKPNVSA